MKITVHAYLLKDNRSSSESWYGFASEKEAADFAKNGTISRFQSDDTDYLMAHDQTDLHFGDGVQVTPDMLTTFAVKSEIKDGGAELMLFHDACAAAKERGSEVSVWFGEEKNEGGRKVTCNE